MVWGSPRNATRHCSGVGGDQANWLLGRRTPHGTAQDWWRSSSDQGACVMRVSEEVCGRDKDWAMRLVHGPLAVVEREASATVRGGRLGTAWFDRWTLQGSSNRVRGPECAGAERHTELLAKIQHMRECNYGVFRARKVRRQWKRRARRTPLHHRAAHGPSVAERCRARPRRASPFRPPRQHRPRGLVERKFDAQRQP